MGGPGVSGALADEALEVRLRRDMRKADTSSGRATEELRAAVVTDSGVASADVLVP